MESKIRTIYRIEGGILDGTESSQHPIWWFQSIWDSINPDYPFESNPWVLAYKFKLIEQGV